MSEDKLEELLKNNESFVPSRDFEKKIRHQMNKKIYFKSLIVVLCMTLVIGTCLFGFSALLDMTNYDPKSENDLVTEREDLLTEGFDILIATYLNMYFPGSTCQSRLDFSKMGFGNYEITYPISDLFEPMIAGVGDKMTIKISRSSIVDVDIQGTALTRQVYDYLDLEAEQDLIDQVLSYGNPQDEYNDILKLPDSAMLDVAISFPEKKDAEELMTFIKTYPDLHVTWVALKTDELMVQGTATGFNLYDSWIDQLSEDAEQQYPSFYLFKDALNEDTMVEQYLSKLKMLIDHPQFTRMMDAYFQGRQIDYKAKYQDVLENGIVAIGVRAQVTKEDLLQLIESDTISHLNVYQVKLSKYPSSN